MNAPLLIMGWGNLSRGDDALGPLFLERLRERLSPDMLAQIEFLDDYQLQIEHALDMVGRQQVLFVDASLNCPPPFEVTELRAVQDASFTTHVLSPQTLMHIYQDLQGEPAPPCTLLAIRGDAFELGEPPGAAALAHLDAALRWALNALQSGVLKAVATESM
jgi:hydrogenase maturation protease